MAVVQRLWGGVAVEKCSDLYPEGSSVTLIGKIALKQTGSMAMINVTSDNAKHGTKNITM